MLSRTTERVRAWRPIATLFLSLLIPQTLAAQPVVNPTTAEFDPSSDHAAVVNGTAIVDRYDLEFYLVGAVQPFQTLSLGKPSPQQDGKIRVDLASVGALPTPGIVYDAVVAAVGPGGAARSARSNTFMWSTTCSYSVTPTTASIAATGTTSTIAVTATSACTWTAATSSSWITITAGSSGSGSGTLTYTVATNTSTASRSATIQVAGQTVAITQAGACSFSVSPTSRTIPPHGGSSTVDVTAASGCTWTATSSSTWLTITSGASGSGASTVAFAATRNGTKGERTATLTVAGQTVTVKQPGSSAPGPPKGLHVVIEP